MSTHKRAILHPTIRDAIDWQDVHEGQPGALPAGRVAVIRADGSRTGHVGHKAGGAVAERLIGRQGVKLGEHEGRPAWIEQPRRGVPARRGNVSAVDQLASLKAAKGSVTATPTKPDPARKPKR